MSWATPWIFWLLPAYALALLLQYLRRKHRSLSLPSASWVRARPTWRIRAIQFSVLLPVLAIALLTASLAGPQRVDVRRDVLPSGVDILVALDISGSMAAEDFQPQNRLAVAKDVLHDFISGRPSDRIGLVLFSGRSITRSPLTLQHDSLLRTLDQVQLGSLPDGTAIGAAMMSGINRLRQRAADAKGDAILLLITDGRNNAGEIHPQDALPIAVKLGIKIYTIGVGSYGKVPFPVFDANGKKTYRYEKADLDEPLLQKIADRTGGRYFRAGDPRSLSELFAQINQLEKSEPQASETRSIRNLHTWITGPALALTFCYILLITFVVRYP